MEGWPTTARAAAISPRDGARNAVVCALLAAGILLVFGRSFTFGYVNYDDPHYVINNYHLHAGLTLDGVRWAFTTGYAENWHPLTWLSHMADFSLYGLHAGAHRFTNVLLHILSSFVLFFVLKNMTRAHWPSFFAAALFAVHPLHVESVVWVAERKDVLSGLFWMLTMAVYLVWARHGGAVRYAALLAVFALGLMAKPMLVTLPCVLLLLDLWPLRRISWPIQDAKKAGRIVLEKVPLLALAAGAAITTYWVQKTGGTTHSFEALPLQARVVNALNAYVGYLGKTVCPLDLAVLYPHPGEAAPLWTALLSGAFLAAVTVLAFRLARGRPYFLTGWLWYLGTLVPVIGLVQVGDQAMADRYTYLPLIGIFVAVVWGIADVVGPAPKPALRQGAIAAGTAVLAVCLALSWRQAGYWRDGVTLFERSLAVNPPSAGAHNNLARAYHEAGRLDDAIHHYEEALQLMPGLLIAENNVGLVLLEKGRYAEAETLFASLTERDPGEPRLYLNLGIARALQDKPAEAEAAFRQALDARPNYILAMVNLGRLFMEQDRDQEAIEMFTRVWEISPGHPDAAAGLQRLGLAPPN